MSKNGPCKLTGVELDPVDIDRIDGGWDCILDTIEEIAEAFFTNNAKEPYEYCDDTFSNYSTHIDGTKIIDKENENGI